jgi:multidrug efflux pump subunit AcrB
VNAVISQGMPAPLDIAISSTNLDGAHRIAVDMAEKIRALPDVSDTLVPQDVDYPALKMDIDRERASELGLSAKDVIDSISNSNCWIDPLTQNKYSLTVPCPEGCINNLADLGGMPWRGLQTPAIA